RAALKRALGNDPDLKPRASEMTEDPGRDLEQPPASVSSNSLVAGRPLVDIWLAFSDDEPCLVEQISGRQRRPAVQMTIDISSVVRVSDALARIYKEDLCASPQFGS